MKYLLAILTLVVCNYSYAFQLNLGEVSQIDSFINKSIKEYNIPGASLIIVKGDSIIYSKGFGFSNLEKKLKMNPFETVVRCGSVSKSFTATAVMVLVDRGVLNLRDPISNYLSEIEINDFGLKDKKISLHQLLTHSAGFDERLFGSHVKKQSEWKPLKQYFEKHPIAFRSKPGQILNYNDQGIALAGYIVEKISKMPFYEFVDEYVFNPLKMSNSSFNPILPKYIGNKLSKSYFYDGSFKPYDYDYLLPYPAAGLVSTPDDIGKFLRFHLNKGSSFLSSKSISEMHNQQFTNNPKLRGWCYGFAEWIENGRRLIFKDGQTTGFNSRLMMLPEENWGFYLVWNRSIFDKGGSINESNNLKSELTTFLIDLFFPKNSKRELVKPAAYSKKDDFVFEGRYSDMSLGNQDWSKILSLAMQIRTVNRGDNIYDISGSEYIRTDELAFQYNTGNNFYAGFTDDSGEVKYLHFGTSSFEKASLFNNAMLQLIVLSIFHLSFLTISIFSFIYLKKKKNRNFLVLGLGSLLMFLGLPLFVISFFYTDFQELYRGATKLMIFSSCLPFIGILLILFAIIHFVKIKEETWLAKLSAFSLLFIPYLIYWNFPII